MKRFTTVYLFITVILTLLANLFFIILYGRQFLFDAAQFCNGFCNDPEPISIAWPILALNAAVLIVFTLGYLIARLISRPNK